MLKPFKIIVICGVIFLKPFFGGCNTLDHFVKTLDHGFKLKKQMCSGEVIPVIEEKVSIILKNPVFGKDDILYLIRGKPVKNINDTESSSVKYILSKVGAPNDEFNVDINMEFTKSKELKLREIIIDINLMEILAVELIKELFKSACNKLTWKGKSIEIKIDSISLKRLPKKKEIIKILGESSGTETNTLKYKYWVDSSNLIDINLKYDGNSLKAVNIKYYIYEISFDFIGHFAKGKINLF